MWAIDTRPAFLPPARLDYRREWGRLAYSFMHSWSMIGERRGENDPVQRLSCHCLKSDSPPLLPSRLHPGLAHGCGALNKVETSGERSACQPDPREDEGPFKNPVKIALWMPSSVGARAGVSCFQSWRWIQT